MRMTACPWDCVLVDSSSVSDIEAKLTYIKTEDVKAKFEKSKIWGLYVLNFGYQIILIDKVKLGKKHRKTGKKRYF